VAEDPGSKPEFPVGSVFACGIGVEGGATTSPEVEMVRDELTAGVSAISSLIRFGFE